MEEYPLTNKCIIAIDTKKYTIYALMSHSLNVCIVLCRLEIRPY